MISPWLIGLMVEADYPLALKSLQGTLTYVPDILALLHANDGDMGLVQCLK